MVTNLSQAIISEALNFKIFSGSLPLVPSKLVPLAITNPKYAPRPVLSPYKIISCFSNDKCCINCTVLKYINMLTIYEVNVTTVEAHRTAMNKSGGVSVPERLMIGKRTSNPQINK